MSNADIATRPDSKPPPRVQRLLPAAIGLALLIAALLLILQVHWTHRFGDIAGTETFVVGPIDPGSAVEQSFVNPTDFLSGFTVAVRNKQADTEPKALVFRLRHASGDLLREGRVAFVPDRATTTSLVDWTFPTVRGLKGQDLDVQISLDRSATIPIEFPVSQADPIRGTLRTNGIPTDQHIDLLLAPLRAASGFGILRVVLRDSLPLLTLVFIAPALWIAALLAIIRYVPGAAAVRIRGLMIGSTIPVVSGLTALTVAAILAFFAGGPAPERRPLFWALCLLGGLPATAVPGYRLVPTLRGTRPVHATLRTAGALARPWRGLERQTLGRLSALAAGPTRLLLRLAVLGALVIAVQIRLVGVYQDDHFREKSDLDEYSAAGFDALYFGDSSVFYTTDADADKRSTAAMLDALLPDKTVVPVAQVAYHPGIYLDFIRYLDRRGELPETVIVPLHVGVFYESLLLGTPYDRQRIVLRFAGTPLEVFTRAWLIFSNFEDSLDHTREYVENSPGTTEYDPIRADNPRLRQAIELAELLVARGVRPIFYLTPLNIAPDNRDLSGKPHRITAANTAFIKGEVEATGATVVDLVDDLGPGHFSSSPDEFLYGHMDEGGRGYVAERLAATIRASGPPQ